MMVSPILYLYFSIILFCSGVFLVLSKKNYILILMGIELIFNASNLNLVAFSQNDIALRGQMFTLFSICIATCETAVALAIILQLYRYFRTPNPDLASDLKN